mgnify:CR=1 FL=1
MITKTKLTITIDEILLKKFNNICDELSINKSKLICGIIEKWCDNNKNNIIKYDIK